MVVNESMHQLGSVRSAIRELFEYGKKRAAIVGKENVYDFSIGNPKHTGSADSKRHNKGACNRL